ncbi:MAG: hypothetical protein JXR71_03180 [Bacteroidales bacterium]|nr:hypothetical protein [Bacteroidales bacterium]
MEYNFNSSQVIKVLYKWRYHLLVIAVLAAVLAAFFSGKHFITPLYKSYAIVYPDNLKPYSEESTTEQMIQVMQSQDIADSMIRRFNLPAHYKLDPHYRYFRTELMREYRENVSVSKTSYEAVDITVLDKSADTAKLMVDALIELVNQKVRRMQKEKFRELANSYAGQLKRSRILMDSLRSVLRTLGNKGIFEYDYQSQQIMKAYLRTISGSPENVNSKAAKELMKNMGNLSGDLIQTVEMLQNEAKAYVDVKISFEREYRHVVSNVTYTNVVTHPFVADKKAYPVRWLIVLVSVVAALAFAVVVIAILERKNFSDQ